MTDRTPSTEQIWHAVATERATLTELLASLPDSAWDHPSLCAEWRVRDVVAHLVLSADADVATILKGLIRARGNFDRLVRDTAIRHADDRTTARLRTELRATIDARSTPLGTTPTDRLMDLLVHGQDIAIPLGIRRQMPVVAARTALDRVWGTARPFRAREKLGGYRLIATDCAWAEGEGDRVEGPVDALLLLTTGRETALERLTGDGAAQLRAVRDRAR